MRDSTSRTTTLAIWLGWIVAAGALIQGPPGLSASSRRALLDLLSPLMMVVDRGPDDGRRGSRTTSPSETDLSGRMAILEAENRELKSWAARYQAQRERDSAVAAADLSERLLAFDLVSARVLGMTQDVRSPDRFGCLIAAGERGGLGANDLVMSGTGVLVDIGRDLGLQPDQLVTTGRILFGRAQEVGRWTTWVRPITDPEFGIAVRVVRHTELGPVPGPRGLLRGDGRNCRLDEIPATEAVRVGDLVETDPMITGIPSPVHCGEIVFAEAPAGSGHWRITVKPACSAASVPEELHVLRTSLNPRRAADFATADSPTRE